MDGALAGIFTNRDNFFDITFDFLNCTSANFICIFGPKLWKQLFVRNYNYGKSLTFIMAFHVSSTNLYCH